MFRRADRISKMARLLTAELGPNFARVAHLDASFMGEGTGMCFGGQGACVDRRLGARPCQGGTLGCKLPGGRDRDVFRRNL